MIDYAAILSKFYPSSLWSLNGSDYVGLEWHDDAPKPTQSELEALWEATHQELLKRVVDDQRREAYSKESDPLFFEWQRGDSSEDAWLAKVAEIKERFPNP